MRTPLHRDRAATLSTTNGQAGVPIDGATVGVLPDGGAEIRLVQPAARQTLVHSHSRTLLTRAAIPVVGLVLWWLLTTFGIVSATTLPSPQDLVRTFWNLLQTQRLVAQVGVSIARALGGLAIGGAVGIGCGAVAGLTMSGEELLDSSLQMLRTVPFLALVPVFVVWLGIGELPKILLISLATTFPLYLNTYNGVRNVDRKVVEAARTFGLHGRRLMREVVLPLSLPSVLTGLRYSLGVSLLALIAAEQINAKSGIGYLLLNAQSYNQVNVIFVCVGLYAVWGLLGDLFVRGLERLLLPWRAGVAAR